MKILSLTFKFPEITSKVQWNPLYGHPPNTDTPIKRRVLFVPTKSSYIS